jgi:coenzyme PQQ precursor peptide PqqA
MLRDGYVAIIRIGVIKDGFCKGKLEHDLALVIGHFENGAHQIFHALDPEQLMDHGACDLPGAIRIAQLFSFGICDQLVADSRIEEVSRHDRTCLGWWSGFGSGRQWAARGLSQLLYQEVAGTSWPIRDVHPRHKNPLMRHWFDGNPLPIPENIVRRNNFTSPGRRGKDSAGELFVLYYACRQGGVRPVATQRKAKMAWKAPKIVEVPVGMEINMYACAARK